MEYGFQVVTKPFADGRISQEVFSVVNGERERIAARLMNTQDQQIREALIALGWIPPGVGDLSVGIRRAARTIKPLDSPQSAANNQD